MRNIFIGFLLIFLDFNLTINASIIGLLPDFVGYILLIKGIDELSRDTLIFSKAKPFSVGMVFYTGILYVIDLLGIKLNSSYFFTFLGIINIAVTLYITYIIVTGVKEIEVSRGIFLNSESLRAKWKLMAIFDILTYTAIIFPALALIFLLVSLIAKILFLFAFNTSKKLYEAIPPNSDNTVYSNL